MNYSKEKKHWAPLDIKIGDHPLIAKKYFLETTAVGSLCGEVFRIIENRTPGAVVYARPRTGKSTGLEMLIGEIQTVFVDLPIILHEVYPDENPGEVIFLEQLLEAAKHAIIHSGTRSQKRFRLIEFMAQKALERGDGRILLILDEAQELHPKHYGYLSGIHNALRRRGVKLIVLLVGQHQLTHQRAAIIQARKDNIFARFMVHMIEFMGITDREEMAFILGQYDTIEYPRGSGFPYSRFFAPLAFDSGWRCKDLASAIWESFATIRKAAKVKTNMVPMEHFCRTVEHVLLHLWEIDIKEKKAVSELINGAVALSGYADLMLLKQ